MLFWRGIREREKISIPKKGSKKLEHFKRTVHVLCASLCLGNGYQTTSCDCILFKGWEIGDPGNEVAAIAVVDMAEDKSTWLDFTWAGSCFEEVVSLPQLARFLPTITQS